KSEVQGRSPSADGCPACWDSRGRLSYVSLRSLEAGCQRSETSTTDIQLPAFTSRAIVVTRWPPLDPDPPDLRLPASRGPSRAHLQAARFVDRLGELLVAEDARPPRPREVQAGQDNAGPDAPEQVLGAERLPLRELVLVEAGARRRLNIHLRHLLLGDAAGAGEAGLDGVTVVVSGAGADGAGRVQQRADAERGGVDAGGDGDSDGKALQHGTPPAGRCDAGCWMLEAGRSGDRASSIQFRASLRYRSKFIGAIPGRAGR